jgi:hypothetical protein
MQLVGKESTPSTRWSVEVSRGGGGGGVGGGGTASIRCDRMAANCCHHARAACSDATAECEEHGLFDLVFVATGQFNIPKLPAWATDTELRRSGFSGKVIHSHDFRRGTDFAGMNVVVVGR